MKTFLVKALGLACLVWLGGLFVSTHSRMPTQSNATDKQASAEQEQVLGMVKSGFLVITAYDRQIEYVRVYGDTVIVAGSETVTWGGQMPNAGKVEHLRFTAIWMKQEGRWQEVARHANIVPQT